LELVDQTGIEPVTS